MTNVLRLDGGKLDKAARTQLGGVRVPATLTRTGVLNYRRGDGTVRRELRLPEEVFHADSLSSLRGAPVTVGHPMEIGGLLDAGTYRKFSVGHTEEARQDGDSLVAAMLVVQDGKTGDAIDRGELTEVSLGYQCRMDETPGVWNGQPYDAIQRGIRYNHVALLAPGKSRANVGLRLDADDAVSVSIPDSDPKLDEEDAKLRASVIATRHEMRVRNATAWCTTDEQRAEAIKRMDARDEEEALRHQEREARIASEQRLDANGDGISPVVRAQVQAINESRRRAFRPLNKWTNNGCDGGNDPEAA